MGQAGSLIIGDLGIMGMWPPMGGLIPRTVIIPGEGPIGDIMERPPMWGVDIIPGEEDPGDWEELG